MCREYPERIPHVLLGWDSLTQAKYLVHVRHDLALMIQFFVMPGDQNLVSKVLSWYFQSNLQYLSPCKRVKELELSGMYQLSGND